MEGLSPGSSLRCLVGEQERGASAETRDIWDGDKEKVFPHEDRGWCSRGLEKFCHVGEFQASTA